MVQKEWAYLILERHKKSFSNCIKLQANTLKIDFMCKNIPCIIVLAPIRMSLRNFFSRVIQ